MEESHHHAESAMHDIKDKGLRAGSVSKFGAVAIGLAATAPAYSLTGALGFGAEASGYQLPIVFIISVIPMVFVALAYKHLALAARDAGTVFTWGAKALTPHIGWFGGWGLTLSSVLAGVGAAEIMSHAVFTVAGVDEPGLALRLAVSGAFILITTALVARGAEESSRATIVLTVIQYVGLILLAGIMLLRVSQGEASESAESFSWSWLNPMAIPDFQALLGGFLVALFIFWGFDAALAMTEETDADAEQASRLGLTSMAIILVTYVVFTIAALAYAGIDPESESSLTHADSIDDVFSSLATGSIGSHGAVVAAIVVGLSAFSATMSTVVATARGLLAMATYKALPARFANVDSATASPKFATWFLGLLTLAIYVVLSLVSESVVQDSVYSVGISICLYYMVAAFSSVAYFHRTAFASGLRNALEQVILPAIGGLVLLYVMVIEMIHMTDPEYGSGSTLFGIGAVFVVGVVMLFVGVPLMVVWQAKAPTFFRGQTLPREMAHMRDDSDGTETG